MATILMFFIFSSSSTVGVHLLSSFVVYFRNGKACGGSENSRPKIFSFRLLPSTIRFNIIHPWVRHSNFSYFVNHIHNIYFTLVQSIGVKLLTSIFPCQFIRIVSQLWWRAEFGGVAGKNCFVRNIQRL